MRWGLPFQALLFISSACPYASQDCMSTTEPALEEDGKERKKERNRSLPVSERRRRGGGGRRRRRHRIVRMQELRSSCHSDRQGGLTYPPTLLYVRTFEWHLSCLYISLAISNEWMPQEAATTLDASQMQQGLVGHEGKRRGGSVLVSSQRRHTDHAMASQHQAFTAQ